LENYVGDAQARLVALRPKNISGKAAILFSAQIKALLRNP
jgi:hypothetical protein